MEFLRYGEDAVRIIFGDSIDAGIHEKVRGFFYYVNSLHQKGIIEIIPSFRSCLIQFDGEMLSFDYLRALLIEREGELGGASAPDPVRHEIPVRYGGHYGPDMEFICEYSGLTEAEVIELHSSAAYTVFAVGFMPGFPYMGILDKRLFTPRLDTPRLKVSEGSVGIAQLQTGVYPFESPAGWRILGRTDADLFEYRRAPYSRFMIGDIVRFVRI
jgi:KipI family sensor histidine kinase inhibitor